MAEEMRGRGFAWKIVPASVAGPAHARLMQVNQDHWAARDLGGGRALLAVADGAGSAEHAAHGALLAVNAAERAAQRCFGSVRAGPSCDWGKQLNSFVRSCLHYFDESVAAAETAILSGQTGSLRRQFATTLLAVIADPPSYGYISVGDGFLIVQRATGRPHLVVSPPEDREHSGGTVFLTSEGRERFLSTDTIYDPLVRGLALCTDGLIEGVLTRSTSPRGSYYLTVPPEFGMYFDLFARQETDPSALARKLQGEDFSRTSGDDKTMLMALLMPTGDARGNDTLMTGGVR